MDDDQFTSNTTVPHTEELNLYHDTIRYICLTSAIISVLVNTLLIVFFVTTKLANKAIYFAISHISGLLVLLSLLDVANYIPFISKNKLVHEVLENVHSHILLCLYTLMLLFCFESFIRIDAICKHRIRIMCIVASAMICYSVSVILFGDTLFYPVLGFRLLLVVIVFIVLTYRIFAYFHNTCTMPNRNVIQLALTLNFFWCWLPDFVTAIYDDQTNVNIKCINSIVSYSNGWLNLIWLYILDSDLKSFLKIFDEGDSRYVNVDVEKTAEKI